MLKMVLSKAVIVTPIVTERRCSPCSARLSGVSAYYGSSGDSIDHSQLHEWEVGLAKAMVCDDDSLVFSCWHSCQSALLPRRPGTPLICMADR